MVAPPLAIDVTRLIRRTLRGRRPTGIDRVTLAYVRHFGSRASASVGRQGWVAEWGPRASALLFKGLLVRHGGAEVPVPATVGQPERRTPRTAEQVTLTRFVLHTGHSGLESPAYLPALTRRGLHPVVLVHDLIPLTHPQFCRAGEAARHLERMRNAVHHAAGVVCNSAATLDDLRHLARERGWPLPPAVVAHLGVDAWALADSKPSRPVSASRGRSHAGAPRPYFVCIGTLEPRKNHQLLLRVWQALAQHMGTRTPDLILLGQRGWMFDEVVADLQASSAARAHIREVKGCSDTQLRRWLQDAQALLMPSFAEGFGMPVAEALACGVPVIAGALPVYREFAGDVPDYLDHHVVEPWTQAVEAYTDPHSPRRAAQLARMPGLWLPDWPAHFNVVEAFLAHLAGQAQRS